MSKPTKTIIYRAVLAPDKVAGFWTVGDLRKFILDCSHQGISDDAPLRRDNDYAFGCDGGTFVAERVMDLDGDPED